MRYFTGAILTENIYKNHQKGHNYRKLGLEDFDAELLLAHSGNQALKLALNREISLILMDVQMPEMDGFETAEILRSRRKTPIIFITANNPDQEQIFKGYQSGAVDYLFKPFNPLILKSKVQVFLELDQQKKQLENFNQRLEETVRIRTHELQYMNQALQRFVPHQFIRLLNKSSIAEVELGDHIEKKMSVFFADIRSFTMLSEKLSPEENFRFINSYLTFMIPVIQDHGGFIDKYIGDAIMALFENADDAVRAAISMFETLRRYNRYRQKMNYIPINIGIGINTGDLVLGTVGGNTRMDGTVIGDAVNIASRVEQLTKIYQTSVLISTDTFLSLEDSLHYHIRYLDCVPIRGKSNEVMIYEVLDGEPQEVRAMKLSTLAAFEHAISLYQVQEFQKAQPLFQECVQQNPQDQAAQIYLKRCQQTTQVHSDDIKGVVN